MAHSNFAASGATRLGSWGEQLAAQYLSDLGWHLVARNWRCPQGELDLVFTEPIFGRAPVGVVVEVKARSGTGFGDPLEAITDIKQQRLRTLAALWRRDSGLILSGLRVDAVGVLKEPGQAPVLRHLRGLP